MRRCLLFFTIMLLFLTSCSSNPDKTRLTKVPTATVDAMAKQLKIESLKGKSLKIQGDVTLGSNHLTSATVDGAAVLVPMSELSSAATILLQLAGTPFSIKPGSPNGQLTLTYRPVARPERQHYLLFFPPNSVDNVNGQIAPASADVVGAFTLNTIKDKGDYVASFIPDMGGATQLNQAVKVNKSGTYVELCQNLLVLTTDATTVRLIQSEPVWAAMTHQERVNVLKLMPKYGQEGVCNSLGVAIAFSRGGVPYDTYRRATSAESMGDVAGIELFFIVVDESRYAAMK